MKTAISIPDRLFKRAERLAKRLGVSRSALYAMAVDGLVKGNEGADITARINATLGPDGDGGELDPDLRDAGRRLLQKAEWDEAR